MGGHEMDPAVAKRQEEMLRKHVKGAHSLICFDDEEATGSALLRKETPVPIVTGTKELTWWEELREFNKIHPLAKISHAGRKRLDRAKENGGNPLPILRCYGFR